MLQVLLPIMQWEATAFGRPVLALVLVASLAIFPVLFIPSGPSMWLAGMIFGYGLGFVIIMIGTTIGMTLPYLIGLLFRDRIHVSCCLYRFQPSSKSVSIDHFVPHFFHDLVCVCFSKCVAMVEEMASTCSGN